MTIYILSYLLVGAILGVTVAYDNIESDYTVPAYLAMVFLWPIVLCVEAYLRYNKIDYKDDE